MSAVRALRQLTASSSRVCAARNANRTFTRAAAAALPAFRAASVPAARGFSVSARRFGEGACESLSGSSPIRRACNEDAEGVYVF